MCECVGQSNTRCDDKTGVSADKGKDDKKDKKGQEKERASEYGCSSSVVHCVLRCCKCYFYTVCIELSYLCLYSVKSLLFVLN